MVRWPPPTFAMFFFHITLDCTGLHWFGSHGYIGSDWYFFSLTYTFISVCLNLWLTSGDLHMVDFDIGLPDWIKPRELYVFLSIHFAVYNDLP